MVKDYVTDAGPFRALKTVSLEVDAGEFIAVVGRSGCGKSTLMNMLTGIDRPTSGSLVVGGTDITRLVESRMAHGAAGLGVIFQFFQLLPTLTVAENVMLPMDFAGLWSGESGRSARCTCWSWWARGPGPEAPGLDVGRPAAAGGDRPSLANDPPILVADEPTGNLDAARPKRCSAVPVAGRGRPDDRDGDPRPRPRGADPPDGPHGRRADPRRDARGATAA